MYYPEIITMKFMGERKRIDFDWWMKTHTQAHTHITYISSNRSGCICNFFLIVDTLRGGFWMCATSWNEKPIWINTNQSEQSSKWGLQPMATHNNRIENNKKNSLDENWIILKSIVWEKKLRSSIYRQAHTNAYYIRYDCYSWNSRRNRTRNAIVLNAS